MLLEHVVAELKLDGSLEGPAASAQLLTRLHNLLGGLSSRGTLQGTFPFLPF